jgi:succinate dehydrogenase / fumarate reductase, membrane anchor subunit
MGYRSDYARVHNLGAAGEGVGHWWGQRISSLALIPLTPLFVIPFGRALGGGYPAIHATYSFWPNALIAVAFLLVGFWHLAQGLQVVIEDYVPGKAARVGLLLATTLLCGAFALAGAFAILTILLRA